MSPRHLSWLAVALLAGVFGGACSTTASESAPVTVSCKRILQYPSWVVRAAIPDAFTELGVGQQTYAAVNTFDTFQGTTESGMSVNITAEPTSDRITIVRVIVVGANPAATWLVNAVPDTVSAHAHKLEPTLSKPGAGGSKAKP